MDGDYTEYYRWLISIIEPPETVRSPIRDYGILLFSLWRRDYFWYDRYEREEDRANDGRCLRERFMMEFDRTPDAVPQGPTNVLEMLIALAIRIDNTVHDWTIGSRPWEWMVMFITNLGLADFTDNNLHPADEGYISDRLERWMSHDIGRRGERGLFRFRTPASKTDIERMTTWDQMQYWVIEFFP